MAGSITLSLTQQFDHAGTLNAGGQVFFVQAGTVADPQNAYQDLGLTNPWPNPYTLLSDGRIPQVYFADGYIKVRITDSDGNTVFNQDNIPVTGPSSGGGGGGGVDPTTILQPGDFKFSYETGVMSGFVRANGRTMGNASSGATERANADTSALYAVLWADPNLAVSGGRGASAAADYAANKTIALPDFRGRAPAGLDDMGNSAAGRLTATYFGTAATVLGAAGGAESNPGLVAGNVPSGVPVSITGTASVTSDVTKPLVYDTGGIASSGATGGSRGQFSDVTAVHEGQVTSSGSVTGTGATTGSATGAAFKTASPMLLVTVYLKL